MSDTISVPRSLLNTLGIIYLVILVTLSTVNIVAIQYTHPQYTVTAQGTVKNHSYDAATKTYTYTLVNGNQTLGTDTTPYPVIQGDTVIYVNYQDSTHIPIIYTPRVWSIKYINGAVAESTEPTVRLNVITYTWLGHILGAIAYKAVQIWRRK